MNPKSVRRWLMPALALCLFVGTGRNDASPLDFVRGTTAVAMLVAPPEGAAEEEKGASRELIYKTINFLILAGALGYLLRKPLADFFSQRSAEIRAGLEEGRKALEASQARLSAVEEKLRRLEEEIASFKAAAAREMDAERQRLRQAAETEAQKILESARSRMDTMARAARLDLKHYAADEALKGAEQIIRARLDDAGRRRLVSQFVEKLQ